MLIRSTSHGNNVSIYYCPLTNTFTKISFDAVGRKYIFAEKEGIVWYTNQKNNKTNSYIESSWIFPEYSRLDLKHIKGRILNYNSRIITNEKFLKRAINHYIKVWPKNALVPVHGDLTLDNIIFNKEQVIFFDWEHFNPKGEKWGFDIAYLLLSAISLPYFDSRSIPRKDLKCFTNLWKDLFEKGLDMDIAKDPFGFFINVFESSAYWTEIIKFSPKKLFPLSINIKIRKKIDSSINENVFNV